MQQHERPLYPPLQQLFEECDRYERRGPSTINYVVGGEEERINVTTLPTASIIDFHEACAAGNGSAACGIENVWQEAKFSNLFRLAFEFGANDGDCVAPLASIVAFLRANLLSEAHPYTPLTDAYTLLMMEGGKCTLLFHQIVVTNKLFSFLRAKMCAANLPPPTTRMSLLVAECGRNVSVTINGRHVASVMEAIREAGDECFLLFPSQQQLGALASVLHSARTPLAPSKQCYLRVAHDDFEHYTNPEPTTEYLWMDHEKLCTRRFDWAENRIVTVISYFYGRKLYGDESYGSSYAYRIDLFLESGTSVSYGRVKTFIVNSNLDDDGCENQLCLPIAPPPDSRPHVVRQLDALRLTAIPAFEGVRIPALGASHMHFVAPTLRHREAILGVIEQHGSDFYTPECHLLERSSLRHRFVVVHMRVQPQQAAAIVLDANGDEVDDGGGDDVEVDFNATNRSEWLDRFVNDYVAPLYDYDNELCDDAGWSACERVSDDEAVVLLRFYATASQLFILQEAAREYSRTLPPSLRFTVDDLLPLDHFSKHVNVGEHHIERYLHQRDMVCLVPRNNAAASLEVSIWDRIHHRMPWTVEMLRRACGDDVALFDEACVYADRTTTHLQLSPTLCVFFYASDSLLYVKDDSAPNVPIDKRFRAINWQHRDDHHPLPLRSFRVTADTPSRSLAEQMINSNGLLYYKHNREGSDGGDGGSGVREMLPYRAAFNYEGEIQRAFAATQFLDATVAEKVIGERFDVSRVSVWTDEQFGDRNLLTVLRGSTGSGKSTALFRMMVKFVALHFDKRPQIVFVAPRQSLVFEIRTHIANTFVEYFTGHGEFPEEEVRGWVADYKGHVSDDAKVLCVTPHSLHRFVSGASGAWIMSNEHERPLMMAFDELLTTLEGFNAPEVLRPVFQHALVSLQRANHIVLLDACLPPLVVANFVNRITWMRRYHFNMSDPTYALSVEIHEATYSMVAEQQREVIAFSGRDGSAKMLDAVEECLGCGQRVAVFCSSLKKLRALAERFGDIRLAEDGDDGGAQAAVFIRDRVMEISSEQRPDDWATVPREIEARDIRLLLYTSAASAGNNWAFVDNIRYFDCVALVGASALYLSIPQMYQAASRVRNIGRIFVESHVPLRLFELIASDEWRALADMTPRDVIQDFVSTGRASERISLLRPPTEHQRAQMRSAVDSVATLRTDQQWVNRSSTQPSFTTAFHPFLVDIALTNCHSYYTAPQRSTFFLSLLASVGYTVKLSFHGRATYTKEERQEKREQEDLALIASHVKAILKHREDALAVASKCRERLLLPPSPPAAKLVYSVEQWLAKLPNVFPALDIACFLWREQAHRRSGAEMAALIQRAASLYHDRFDRQLERVELARSTRNALPISQPSIGRVNDRNRQRDAHLIRGCIIFGAMVHARIDTPFPDIVVAAAQAGEEFHLPSLSALLRGEISSLSVSQWLVECRNVIEKRKLRDFDPSQFGRPSNKSWWLFTKVCSSLFCFSSSSHSRYAISYEHSTEMRWLSEFYQQFLVHNHGKTLCQPGFAQTPHLDAAARHVDLLSLSVASRLAAQQPLDDYLDATYTYDFDTADIKRRKRQMNPHTESFSIAVQGSDDEDDDGEEDAAADSSSDTGDDGEASDSDDDSAPRFVKRRRHCSRASVLSSDDEDDY